MKVNIMNYSKYFLYVGNCIFLCSEALLIGVFYLLMTPDVS